MFIALDHSSYTVYHLSHDPSWKGLESGIRTLTLWFHIRSTPQVRLVVLFVYYEYHCPQGDLRVTVPSGAACDYNSHAH